MHWLFIILWSSSWSLAVMLTTAPVDHVTTNFMLGFAAWLLGVIASAAHIIVRKITGQGL